MVQFYSSAKRSRPQKELEVTIDELDPFGQGVARHQGKTLFVSGALPGERVRVTILEDKRQFSRGKATRLLSTSPQRVAPRCQHFGVCGGCQQQHATLELQHQSKTAGLQRMLSQSAGRSIDVEQIISADEWHYRRRARLSLRWNKPQQQLDMGFRKNGSNDIVNISQCPVLVQPLTRLLPELRQCLTELQGVRHLGHLELVQADNTTVLVLRHLKPFSAEDLAKLERFSQSHQLTLFFAADNDTLQHICGEMPYYQSHNLKLSFSPQDFIQVNDKVNQQMVATAIDWLALQPGDRVLDLFCGMGNFTLPLGKFVENVVGVEGVAALVRQAAYNAQDNDLPNVSFFRHDLEQDVTGQPWATQGFNKILLDPARAGAAGIMSHIIALAPERILYVSCNPATLARDSEPLLAAGYALQRVAMLDMFPHTSHLESMVLFSRTETT
ncbi:23S rRNA (uracil(1939)-C(5))-methyltransferase RlmD [Tatumella sp. UBA2305]|uniref:23S rRNA (uracil(1939)-C(5))-methyltransferase RlmD n=1 Tax=Tatumella sp. UBA2305 TaxID=1947647 RepID=UPI0025F3A13B|nr:23S rRNA (uracil(1939)-C(5))-methyltransferase RlmD [Tatumella sp. UBA2305]